MMKRTSKIERETKETKISLQINLDGTGKRKIETKIGFFDHMLDLLSKHGLFDLNIKALGDLNVDGHHTVEDVGIVLGKAIKEALGDKKSINRYGHSYVPMDESLALCVVDLGGRPCLVLKAEYNSSKVGEMDVELIEEFFRAVSINAEMNIHIKVLYGSNNHHIIEAMFKAFAKALSEASRVNERIIGVMSTKGVL